MLNVILHMFKFKNHQYCNTGNFNFMNTTFTYREDIQVLQEFQSSEFKSTANFLDTENLIFKICKKMAKKSIKIIFVFDY